MISKLELEQLNTLIKRTGEKRGTQYPNPAVGAMVVSGDVIISEGYHLIAGGPHAEVIALDIAGDKSKEATLLITLEPCTHSGKTAPCVNRIIESGITRVIWAVNDPNPMVGNAKLMLMSNGIDCVDAAQVSSGQAIIKEFMTYHKKSRPFVVLKLAVSLDWMLAPNRNGLTYISSQSSLETVQELRYHSQAILVGVDTINIDHPNLRVKKNENNNQPAIIIIDPLGNINYDWLNRSLEVGRHLIVFCNRDITIDITHDLLDVHSSLISDKVKNWTIILDVLFNYSFHSILVEGGAKVALSLFEANIFDELWLFKTPHQLASSESVPLEFPNGQSFLNQLDIVSEEVIDQDQLIIYKHKDAF